MLNTGLVLVLGLAVAILAGLLLARRMTGPIRELDAGAARIGAGALDHRIAVHTGDELEELAQRFNTMAADLQSSYADLEKKVEDRTAELKEALDQQTATAEVLGVINSSPGDLAPVFDAMLEKATRLCEAAFGIMSTYDGERFHAAALHGCRRLSENSCAEPLASQPGKRRSARMLAANDLVHIADQTSPIPSYRSGDPRARRRCRSRRRSHAHGCTAAQGWQLLGAIAAYRQEVRPFTDKQIALLQNSPRRR